MNLKYICKNCGGQASWNVDKQIILCENCGSQEFNYEVLEKCPNCGSNILYDEKLSRFYCENCNFEEKEIDINELDNNYEYEEDNLGTFNSNSCTCDSCGAEIIIDNNTVATKCPFCNSNVQISHNIIGALKPYGIIPFKFSKEQAGEAFKKWCKKGLLCPPGFVSADRIEEIKSVYIPFWLYDIEGLGTITYHATKVRRYSKGDYNIRETKHYKCFRSIDAFIDDIPCDASERMDDKQMDLLEPFNFKELKPFNIGFLSGNLTEKYNFTEEELTKRIFERADKFFKDYASTSMNYYTSYTIEKDDLKIRKKSAHYILLPIWTISYNYNGKRYTFAMNGQTGKVVGKPPISKKKVFLGGLSIFSIISILETILMICNIF